MYFLSLLVTTLWAKMLQFSRSPSWHHVNVWSSRRVVVLDPCTPLVSRAELARVRFGGGKDLISWKRETTSWVWDLLKQVQVIRRSFFKTLSIWNCRFYDCRPWRCLLGWPQKIKELKVFLRKAAHVPIDDSSKYANLDHIWQHLEVVTICHTQSNSDENHEKALFVKVFFSNSHSVGLSP